MSSAVRQRPGKRAAMGRQGIVLFAVLLVIVLASLAGTTALIVAEADRSGAVVSLRRTQARALAWSGVQAVMAELAAQRDELLDGRRPRVTEEWALLDGGGEARGIFRIVSFGSDEPLVSEAAKLDLNTATPEMLSGLPGVSADLADRIVRARDAEPLTSVEALLEVDGIDPVLFYGPTESPGTTRGQPTEPALAGLVTVFQFDPNVQLGLGPGGEGHRGELRLNVNTAWTPRLERALIARFDRDFAEGVKQLLGQRKFQRDSDFAGALREFGVEPKDWVQTFDVFTASPDPFLAGRVDINRAPAEVLGCIPGIDRAAAGRIVALRGRLDEEALRSVTWPVSEGVLTPEQFQQAVDFLTTRSMQWRVRVEAGFETDSNAERVREASDAPILRDRIVLEAVIDIASERPRIAYLRDITGLDGARRAWERAGPEPISGEVKPDSGGAAAADEPPAGEDPARPSRLGRAPSRLAAAENQQRERRRPPGTDMGAESEGPDGAIAPVAAFDNEAEAGQDRRIGRWTPSGGRRGGAP